MTIHFRNTLFVLAGALAGFLSGFTLPLAYGARGAILGATISAGSLFLRPRRNCSGDKIVSPLATAGFSIAVTIVAVTAISLWHLKVPVEKQNMDFSIPLLSVQLQFAACLSFALPLLLFYRERQANRQRAWAWILAAPFLGAGVRSWGFHRIDYLPFTLVFGALPFVLLWLLAAIIADPAWTKRRWGRYAKPRSVE
jgi:hypothetical protein